MAKCSYKQGKHWFYLANIILTVVCMKISSRTLAKFSSWNSNFGQSNHWDLNFKTKVLLKSDLKVFINTAVCVLGCTIIIINHISIFHYTAPGYKPYFKPVSYIFLTISFVVYHVLFVKFKIGIFCNLKSI